MEHPVTAEAFPPGEYIADEMEARGWTQDDLAEILGRSRVHINRLVQGKTAITPDTAHELAKAFGNSAAQWMNLQVSYELALAAKDERDIERRATIFSKVPIRDIKARGWITETDSVDDLESQVCRLLRIDSIDQDPMLSGAARMSTSYGETANAAQIAWIFRARQLAEAVCVSSFSKAVFDKGVDELRSLAAHPQDARRVPRFLADIGVRLVLIEHLPKSKIDGVAFWVGDSPAVALSLRFDRMDNFWFTLMHELVHVKYGDDTLVDVELDRPPADLPEAENRANREAAEALIPREKLESFLQGIRPLYNRDRVVEFSRTRGVHPSIVVGQLQHHDPRLYNRFRALHAKVRDYLLGQAITDGWGNFPSVVG